MKCKDCGSELNPGAKKCHSCGSYQNWLRYFHSGQLVVGFILLILTFLALEPIKTLIQGNRPDVTISIVSVAEDNLNLAIYNHGLSPAVMVEVYITMKPKHDSTWDLVLSFIDFEDRILKPNELKTIDIPLAGLSLEPLPSYVIPSENHKKCRIVYHYTGMKGGHILRSIPMNAYIREDAQQASGDNG